jgi:hypothetical protein
MKLVIELNLDNAAFESAPNLEAARILHGLATDIGRSGPDPLDWGIWTLRDANGNRVGSVSIPSDGASPVCRPAFEQGDPISRI